MEPFNNNCVPTPVVELRSGLASTPSKPGATWLCAVAITCLITFIITTNNAVGRDRYARHPSGNAKQKTKITSAAARAKARAKVEKILNCPAKFIVSMCRDNVGNIWVGTEDSGVYRYNPSASGGNRWKQFTTADGLGDNNAYALVCDKQGRIWAGNLNHGVSVYNGKRWQDYDVIADPKKHVFAGPIGERVFAEAVNPVNGDVWLATSAGLCRYKTSDESWHYYTRANGLASDQANALAFGKHGRLYVGTQCDGIAISTARQHYKHWRVIRGPWKMPTRPTGHGLPSNLINRLLVMHNGTVVAGTDGGLAFSRNHGRSWRYLRGQDYVAKVRGRYHAPQDWAPAPPRVLSNLPLEDYITCLGEQRIKMRRHGRVHDLLWVCYRQQGYEVIDLATGRKFESMHDPAMAKTDGYISAMVAGHGQAPIIARYGGKITQFKREGRSVSRVTRAASANRRDFPAGAPTPHRSALQRVADQLLTADAKARHRHGVRIATLDDDWRTQGNWLGHYGHDYSICCAMNGAANDQDSGHADDAIAYHTWLGPHANTGDSLRYWVQWITTSNHRTLQNLMVGGRKEAEWDDHGEAYPMAHAGPGVNCTLELPAGQYLLAGYFFNKDGHGGSNRFRDYVAQVRATPMGRRLFNALGSNPAAARIAFRRWSLVAANARVSDFWGGVYKRFFVRLPRPMAVTFSVRRNHSFNTLLCGLFVDGALPLHAKAENAGLLNPPVHFNKAPVPQPAARAALLRNMSAALGALRRLQDTRSLRPQFFIEHGRTPTLLLARYFAALAQAGPSPRHGLPGLPASRVGAVGAVLAGALREQGMPVLADRFALTGRAYRQFAYRGRTDTGKNYLKWKWSWKKYERFARRRAAHGWY